MSDSLTIFKLKVSSSYVKNQELPAVDSFDTLQFYAHGDAVMRIKTYAVDHDIHMHLIPLRGRSVDETLAFLTSSTKEHYTGLIEKEYRIALENPRDSITAENFFREHDMHPQLVSEPGYAYWNPDGGEYKTQSNPLSSGQN